MAKCYDCGQEIEGHGIIQTRCKSTSLSSLGQRRGFQVEVCSDCARRRSQMPYRVFFAFCLAFGIVGLIAALLHR
jgi:hypothetical protein